MCLFKILRYAESSKIVLRCFGTTYKLYRSVLLEKKLGGAEDVIKMIEIAYNPIMQMLVIRAVEEEDERTLKWAVERNDRLTMRRCPCKGFSNALFDNMGWNLDYKYKLIGGSMMIDNQPVLVFTLEDPVRIVPITVEKKKEETGKN